MSSFVKGLLVGVLLVFVMIGLIGTVALIAGGSEPTVQSESALVVRLEGGIPEHSQPELPSFFPGQGGGSGTNLYDLVEAIRAAAEDDRIEALVLHCEGSAAGWAKAQELRWAIQAFRESEKPVWAYFALAGGEGYYIASLADHLVIQPESILYMFGLRAEVTFFKNSLEKLGIEADLIRSGKYKSAGEVFTREGLSPESREVMNSTLDELYGQFLGGITEGRGYDADHWEAILDKGPFSSLEAKEHGLVDDILYEDEFYERLSEAVDIEEIREIDGAKYADIADSSRRGGTRFAMLHAVGAITSGSSWSDPFSGRQETLGAETFSSNLERLREDDSIAGVILRIDSPGGDAIASDRMLHEVRRLQEEKPVVVSMSTLAASGGYYIASAPEVPIIAYPGTYTGSIGVFTMHLNLRGLYDKLGITKEILKRGQNAAADSDYKAMTEAERERLAQFVDRVYDTFLSRVSEGRGIDVDTVQELAQGRVWTGSQAAENGLVDELGGYQKAIELLREAAEVEDEEPVRIVHYPPRRSLLESLFSMGARADLGILPSLPGASTATKPWLRAILWAASAEYRPLYLAPYTLTIQ